MNETQRQSEVDQYLRALDLELAGLPALTAAELRAGIAEELSSLDPDDAHERILQLGDPAHVAAQARLQMDPSESTPKPAPRSSTWYVVVASVAVAVGGIVIPLIGWLAGIVMVWLSPVWSRGQKLVATLGPLGLAVIVYIVMAAIARPQATSEAAVFSVTIANSAIAFAVANIAVGTWLLLTGIRRTR